MQDAEPREVPPGWTTLGERLGFLAPADLLAVVEWPGEGGEGLPPSALTDRVSALSREIGAGGYPYHTVFVAAEEPSPELDVAALHANAYVLAVPAGFGALGRDDRARTVLELVVLPDHADGFLDEVPPREATVPPPPPDAYMRNPALTDEEVQAWFSRLSGRAG